MSLCLSSLVNDLSLLAVVATTSYHGIILQTMKETLHQGNWMISGLQVITMYVSLFVDYL